MKKKFERIQHLVNIQKQREKMATIKLAETINTQQQTGDRVDEVINALASFDPVHIVLSNHYLKRLSRLEFLKRQLLHHRQKCEKNMKAEQVKTEHLEKKANGVKSLEAREREEEDLSNLIDLLAGVKNPASGKL